VSAEFCRKNLTLFWLLLLLALSACNLQSAETVGGFRATVPPTQSNAPLYTPTPTPTETPVPTDTPAGPPTATMTSTAGPTPGIQTLTPASPAGAPAGEVGAASVSGNTGWSCDDFPCEDDIDGFLQRIRVPDGFALSYVGQFPGQPLQMTYGQDGWLYATALVDGTLRGHVFRMGPDGTVEQYTQNDIVSPLGLAFQPGSDVLYISARMTPESGGGVWRILPDLSIEVVVTDLPCCYQIVNNQPNGLVFGPDGYLYLGVGGISDQAEPPPGRMSNYLTPEDDEAAILRIQPHTGEYTVYARGLRNPYDLTFGTDGQLYVSDNGIVDGPGDRVVKVDEGAHYGWPYYRDRNCANCPEKPAGLTIAPDWLRLPDYTLPRGMTTYTATQFPEDLFGDLFVTFWNGGENGQRVVHIDPSNPTGFEPFVTGLIRPADVVIAPDGSLMVTDFIYGHVWRVVYEG
jgi:sugar lactone lactonase YvrE